MKTTKHFSIVAIACLISLFLSSCETSPKVDSQGDILPKTRSVSIPSSISSSTANGRISGRVQQDSLSGNDIYQNLNLFIAVGAGASVIVDGVINSIRHYHIEKVVALTYVSDDDHRTKDLIVSSSVSFEGKTWDYEMTINDTDAVGEADGGKALQIFWNKTAPIKGIAIIKPYNCDRIKNVDSPEAIFRIDYSEEATAAYDATMEVQIAGLPLANPLNDAFSINTLHMFVGKKGDNVDVSGNSNHPNAILFSGETGFDWAFVASGSDSKNIAVAEVGLPSISVNSNDRNVLLKEYSIENVFTTGINAAWPGIDPTLVANYLKNTAAPGYFNASGFVKAGKSPGTDWDALYTRTEELTPYSPALTNDLTLNFK